VVRPELVLHGKRKVGITVGYVGTEFLGLQSDEMFELPTIERELEQALGAAGGISGSNRKDLGKIGWSRSSRTDKGVHATKTVISAKLEMSEQDGKDVDMDTPGFLPNYASFTARVNEHLPDSIRVFGVAKACKGFRARESCSYRDYEYLLPLEYFCRDAAPNWDTGTDAARASAASSTAGATEVWSKGVPGTTLDGVLRNVLSGDAAAANEVVQRLGDFQEALQLYEGAHSFHNFHRMGRRALKGRGTGEGGSNSRTEGGKQQSSDSDNVAKEQTAVSAPVPVSVADDASTQLGSPDEQGVSRPLYDGWSAVTAKRRILDRKLHCIVYQCRVTGLLQTESTEGSGLLVRVSITGQAFLLHMIRLMIGGALTVATDALPLEAVKTALRSDVEIPLPMAPAHGLILQGSAYLSTSNGEPYLFPATTTEARERENAAGAMYVTSVEGLAESERFKLNHIYPQVAADWSAELASVGTDVSSEGGMRPPFASWFHHTRYRYTPPDQDSFRKELLGAPTKGAEVDEDGAELLYRADRELFRVESMVKKAYLISRGNEKGTPFSVRKFFPNAVTTALHIRCGTLPGQNFALLPAMRAYASAMVEGRVPVGLSVKETVDRMTGSGTDELECLAMLTEWAKKPKLDVVK
jgi:tRNA pseudouridine(38-40) synthase